MSKILNIGNKIFTGALWMVAMRMTIRFLGIISVIILARLLEPEDFGLVAKAVMIQSFLLIFMEMGLEAALIKDQEATVDHYNTVWTLQIIRGIFVALILAFVAKTASNYFHDERLELIIYSYAGIMAISGFYNIGVVDFRKHLKFSSDFRYGLYRKLTSFLTTITVAIIWQSYWALVAGVVAGQLISIISSYMMSSFRPLISLAEWKSLFHFSKWMTLHELLSSAGGKIDVFILSRFSTSATLGLYTVSKELAVTPTIEICMPVARAMMPGLSKVNNDINQVRKINQNIIGLLLVFIIPASIGIHLLAGNFTEVILGEKWLAATPFVSILALTGMFYTFSATATSVFVAIDKVNVLSKLGIFSFIFRLFCLSFGFWFNGAIGMITGVVVFIALYATTIIFFQRHLKILRIRRLIQNSWRSVIATSTMYFILRFTIEETGFTSSTSALLELATLVILGSIIYALTLLFLWILSGKPEGPEKTILNYLMAINRKE